MPGAPGSDTQGSSAFDAMERYAKLNSPPPVKFKDLEEKVNTRIRYNLMPFDMRSDIVKITSDTVLVPITIQIKTKDMTFLQKEGIQRASVNIFGRISTISGRVASTFEDTVGVDEPNELMEKALLTTQLYWKAIPLKPGMYKIEVAVKDVNGDRVGTLVRSIRVPEFDPEKLASSSLILADLMERVPARNIGTGNFIIGDTKVRPRLDASDGKPASFKRDQRLNLWLQVYNLQQDKQSRKTNATIAYDIVNLQSNKSVLHADESSATYGDTGDQITIEKSMPLASLDPGAYSVTNHRQRPGDQANHPSLRPLPDRIEPQDRRQYRWPKSASCPSTQMWGRNAALIFRGVVFPLGYALARAHPGGPNIHPKPVAKQTETNRCGNLPATSPI